MALTFLHVCLFLWSSLPFLQLNQFLSYQSLEVSRGVFRAWVDEKSDLTKCWGSRRAHYPLNSAAVATVEDLREQSGVASFGEARDEGTLEFVQIFHFFDKLCWEREKKVTRENISS